jgi:threonyl-tRNA synthetase
MENTELSELQALRHTASHILAQAVKRLYPTAKLAIGPAIENGFYYDFDCETSFTPEVLEQLEKEMKKIVNENLKVERFVLPRNEALALMKDEPYKTELINDLPEGEEISFYKQGEFTDLCAGPHVSYTKKVKAFKLLSSTGAYWRGDSNNKMLQRIYGTAFKTQEELEKYLADVEEAKKRDHNKIGRQLGYFTTVDLIGQGLPIILPKGTLVLRTLQRFVEDEEERRGYLQTKTRSSQNATFTKSADTGTTTATICLSSAIRKITRNRTRRFSRSDDDLPVPVPGIPDGATLL